MPHVNKYHINERLRVMNGTLNQTAGGLKKTDLTYNKQGLIVSRHASAVAKKKWKKMAVGKKNLFIKNQQALIDGKRPQKKRKTHRRRR